jgi:hypothetical protein
MTSTVSIEEKIIKETEIFKEGQRVARESAIWQPSIAKSKQSSLTSPLNYLR